MFLTLKAIKFHGKVPSIILQDSWSDLEWILHASRLYTLPRTWQKCASFMGKSCPIFRHDACKILLRVLANILARFLQVIMERFLPLSCRIHDLILNGSCMHLGYTLCQELGRSVQVSWVNLVPFSGMMLVRSYLEFLQIFLQAFTSYLAKILQDVLIGGPLLLDACKSPCRAFFSSKYCWLSNMMTFDTGSACTYYNSYQHNIQRISIHINWVWLHSLCSLSQLFIYIVIRLHTAL